MNIWLVISAISILVVVGITLRFILVKKKIKELKSKTEFSVESDDLMKLSFDGDEDLTSIAKNFNVLVNKYQNVKSESVGLKLDRDDKETLSHKVKNFEDLLSQITLLTDIGKKITASLNVGDIMHIVFDYVRSAMHVQELELMYFENGKSIKLSIGLDNKIVEYDAELELSNSMVWALENNREVFLNNAKEDYLQYLFEPIKSFRGAEPGAIICFPLLLNDKKIGAVGVLSEQKDVYNPYHLEFIKTLASYLAVALDNSNVYQLLASGKEQIEEEKAKSDALLLNILPAEVAEELKEKGQAKAKSFSNVTVLFTDFVNFTATSGNLSPEELVTELDLCFKKFDAIIEKNGLEKIKTIGDAYLAVGGMPNEDPKHALGSVMAALEIRDFIDERAKNSTYRLNKIRIGLNSGPVVAGIVGFKKFAYDIWGDTVNVASRMESGGEAGKINISRSTYEMVKDNFQFTYRGKIDVKGKAAVDMYFVDGLK